jgi:hypothetical protein
LADVVDGCSGRREIWVDGERITDVVSHPKLRGAAHALAEIYDLQHVERAACLMADPESGESIPVSHMIPRSREDLRRRGKALRTVAEYSVGLMGRTPDYMNVTYAGFAGRPDEWVRMTTRVRLTPGNRLDMRKSPRCLVTRLLRVAQGSLRLPWQLSRMRARSRCATARSTRERSPGSLRLYGPNSVSILPPVSRSNPRRFCSMASFVTVTNGRSNSYDAFLT